MATRSRSRNSMAAIRCRPALQPTRSDGWRRAIDAPPALVNQLLAQHRTRKSRLEHTANLDLRVCEREGIRLDPFDRFFLRRHLNQPETGDQLLRLRERAV